MKTILLLALTLTSFATTSFADLLKVTCEEELPPSTFEVLRYKLIVKIKETKDITKAMQAKGASVDLAAVANVQIARVDELGGHYQVLKQFSAISTTSDVEYRISSVKKNGFKFYLYLDEYDQAGVELTDANGNKQKTRLVCR